MRFIDIFTIALFFMITCCYMFFLSCDIFDNQAKIISQNDQIIELLQPDIALDLTQDFGSPMIHEYKTIKPKVKK